MTKRVFQQLDECVKQARKAERTENWSEAQREAEKLQHLINFVHSAEAVANSVAVISGVYQHDWILVAVSSVTVLGVLIVLWTSKRKK